MFDLLTALASISIVGSLFTGAWILAALILSGKFGSGRIAAGYLLITTAGVTVSFRGPLPVAWHVALETAFVLTGTMVLTQGVMVLLARRPALRLVRIAFAPLLASLLLPGLFPADAGRIHIHIITLGCMLAASFVAYALLRVQKVSVYLRLTLGAVFVLQTGVFLLRSYLAEITPAVRPDYVLDMTQAWFFLEGSLFLPVLGLVLFLIVVFHLTASLQRSNEELVEEVAGRRKAQGALAVALEKEKVLRDEQKNFLRLFSHEVRTPIAMIGRSAEMLQFLLDKPAPNIAERLENIQIAAQRLDVVAEKFLVVDQDKSGSVKLAELAVADLLAEVRRHFSASDFGDRIRWSMPDEPLSFAGDSEMINTVLINLIDNALKFSPDDCPVDVRAHANGAHVVFDVLDRGPGIAPDELGEVGQKYFRGSNSASVPGSGLGLFSTLKLLSYHDADLQLSAREGGGTVARVLVPRDCRKNSYSESDSGDGR